jgi:uncharacterized protein (TIGR02271 family)
MAASRLSDNDDAGREAVLTVAEEQLEVSKHKVSEGFVRVRLETESYEDFARADLERRNVDVTRVKVGTIIDSIPAIRTEGDLTIVPVVEEVLVVEKRLMLKEELHIRSQTEKTTIEQPVTLRRQRATVDRLDAAGQPITEAEPNP